MTDAETAQRQTGDDVDGSLRQAVLDVFRIAEQASEQVPEERRHADLERNPMLRHYTTGLIDGMEEAQKHLLAPLVAWAEAHADRTSGSAEQQPEAGRG